MSVHEYDDKMKSDDEFVDGDISLLVEGNHCRLLDGRRTTGVIEKYYEDCGMFRWRITKYEDTGKYWDLPAESVKGFQFQKDSLRLSYDQIKQVNKHIIEFDKDIKIEAKETDRSNTEKEIKETKEKIEEWLKENSLFLKSGEEINFSSREGSKLLGKDLMNYMKYIGMLEEEIKTAETMVLNPNSGEWVKGMNIVLGEMGLVTYQGKMPRTKDIFKGLGDKNNRRKYLINRLAFIRAYFSMLDIDEVVLYRGMSNEKRWKKVNRTYLPCTFSLEVAKAFSDFERESKYKNSYLVKMTCPIDKLFMTYWETEAMNRQYKEAEALVLYNDIMEI